jgi:polyferredoxin
VAADAKMLLFFEHLSTFAAAVLAALALLSVVVKHFWCRYLCPYGALLGLASLASPQRVVRDPATCNDCRACARACPVEIPVHARSSVWTAECTGCMSCVSACTVPDCLTTTRRGKKGLAPWVVPASALAAFLAVWAIARATGHWQTALPPDVLARVYRLAPLLSH